MRINRTLFPHIISYISLTCMLYLIALFQIFTIVIHLCFFLNNCAIINMGVLECTQLVLVARSVHYESLLLIITTIVIIMEGISDKVA